MNTFIMEKMQRAQARFVEGTDSGARMRQQIGMDWSDPDNEHAWPATLIRCGAEHSRALLRRCRISADGAADPEDMHDHELGAEDQAALDAFMRGGL